MKSTAGRKPAMLGWDEYDRHLRGSDPHPNLIADLASVTGTLAIANGGTAATTAADARTNLEAQKSIQFQDESADLATPGVITHLNFTGAGISAGVGGTTVTVTASGVPTAHAASHEEAGSDRITALALANTALSIRDTGNDHDLTLKPNENLSANKTLSIVTGDADRSLTFTADATIGGTHSGTSSGTNTGDQTLYNQTFEDEGTPVTQRSSANFTGAGVSVADAGGKTVVTIAGGAGGDPSYSPGSFTVARVMEILSKTTS